MKEGVKVLLIVGCLAAAWYSGKESLLFGKNGDGTSLRSLGPTINGLERLSHLVSTRVYVSDVLVGEGNGYRGSWLVKGDALAAVDLGKAKIESCDEAQRRAVIRLPRPSVMAARVDHTRTKKWDISKVTWIPWGGDPDALRDRAMLQAQQLIEHAAGTEEVMGEAMVRAQSAIMEFYSVVGWTVTVQWESVPQITGGQTPANAKD
jgi:hypothetical protein